MIYLDTSVALAQLLAEDRCPPAALWRETLVASRLLEYEAGTRIHALGLARSHAEPLRQLLERVAFIELARDVLRRALEPFPAPVRTLDALHLASLEFLRAREPSIALASYDAHQRAAASALGIELAPI